MITNSDALKPCPFCGGKANIADNTGPKLCTSAHAYVFCLKRGCPGRGDEQETVDEAVAAWNNREASEARARLEGAKAMQARRKYPVLGTQGQAKVDWQFVEDHAKQAYENHRQTVERLAERGGLSWSELCAVVQDRKWSKMETADAIEQVRAAEARYLAALDPAQIAGG
jgi:Lar family restriction alleviation protein